jgi:hypothetical protein
MALATVHEQVKRTRLGYRVRELEKRKKELIDEKRVRRVGRESVSAPEALVARGIEFRIAPRLDLEALLLPPRMGPHK